jgi:hypothetical protein
MRIIYFIILLFKITCYSYIVLPEEYYKYEKSKLPDGKYKISYRNGETFIGTIDQQEIPINGKIFETRTQTAIAGISQERGFFIIKNNRPEWCQLGDCYNGKGQSEVKRSESFLPERIYFAGEFKDFKEMDGVIAYSFDKIYYKVKGGERVPTPLFASLEKDYKNKQVERERIEGERRIYDRNRQREESERLNAFIYKMWSLGAYDWSSCLSICKKYYNMSYCHDNCDKADRINR